MIIDCLGIPLLFFTDTLRNNPESFKTRTSPSLILCTFAISWLFFFFFFFCICFFSYFCFHLFFFCLELLYHLAHRCSLNQPHHERLEIWAWLRSGDDDCFALKLIKLSTVWNQSSTKDLTFGLQWSFSMPPNFPIHVYTCDFLSGISNLQKLHNSGKLCIIHFHFWNDQMSLDAQIDQEYNHKS